MATSIKQRNIYLFSTLFQTFVCLIVLSIASLLRNSVDNNGIFFALVFVSVKLSLIDQAYLCLEYLQCFR